MWRIAPYADTSETTLRSTLRLVMTLAAAPAVFGAFWLAANSVPVRAPEPTTLRMSHSIIPGQRVTVSGNNHVVAVAPGGSRTSTENGVLSFSVTAAGLLQP